MITIESKDIVITRVTENDFIFMMGDIDLNDSHKLTCYVGETITIPILGMLIQRNKDKTLMCKLTEG